MNIKDLNLDQSIDIDFSHFRDESVYFSIKFNSPIGAIVVDPKIHYSFAYIGDMDNIVDIISNGLRNNLRVIRAGCMEPLFTIEIIRSEIDDDIYEFIFMLDLGKVLNNKPSHNGPCISLTVQRGFVEQFIRFLKNIARQYNNGIKYKKI